MSDNRKPYIGRASAIETAIGRLEGWSFGRVLCFSTAGYALRVDSTEIDGFRMGLPGLDDFARELDAAVAPVCERYAQRLRRELANECVDVAERSIAGIKQA